MFAGWKTYLVAGLSGVFGVLATLDWNSLISDQTGWGVAGMSLLMALMRAITSTPPAVGLLKK
jgi:hypothetical protein